MEKIDVFAHVLLPQFKDAILKIAPSIPEKMPFVQHPLLANMEARRQAAQDHVKQVLSYVNTNPEDYLEAEQAAMMVQSANQELLDLVAANQDIFYGAVLMLPMNNIPACLKIIESFANQKYALGFQIFTRQLGKSIADPTFAPVIESCAQKAIPLWLHPVFDERKPDNNIIFSWEYEQTQAMLQLVQAGYFQKYPDLKIIVHHAGAMAPYFAGRINHILAPELAQDFRKFYVDTALLGNSKALELAIDYFGHDHVLFGTDAPLGIAPAGATKEIIQAITQMKLPESATADIFQKNFLRLIGRKE
ncbi:4-oxalomesaconate hydratase [Streptococcus bovimastitidis]|uniref:4-oxalomesaconate hydratase n=1 Tax=Streptococcus bovimastitidis TaxID=1856638 RepID=A0A1L8MMK8_9STRE|nr:amidohydrolase family protein [Streptococcus bovimastitidis]OJF71971.1 4-oxalomesaconate hydratase [Streptococcus bovimastitidis]